jgi:hypothetical protein
MPAVIVVGADKGGVGKTTVSRTLLDYFAANNVATRAFDTESPRGTRAPPDPALACGAAYFDPDIYTGTNGLVVWQIAGIGMQSQYRLGAGFARSPMDANARLVDGDK